MKINAGTLRMTEPLTGSAVQEKKKSEAETLPTGDTLALSDDGREKAAGLPKIALDPDAQNYAPTAKPEEREPAASSPQLDGNTLKKGGGGGFGGAGSAGSADEAEGTGDESDKLLKELQKQITKLQEKRQELATQPQSKERDSQLSSIDAQISVLQAQILEATKKSGASSGGTPGLEATGGSGLSVKAHFA